MPRHVPYGLARVPPRNEMYPQIGDKIRFLGAIKYFYKRRGAQAKDMMHMISTGARSCTRHSGWLAICARCFAWCKGGCRTLFRGTILCASDPYGIHTLALWLPSLSFASLERYKLGYRKAFVVQLGQRSWTSTGRTVNVCVT